jgi:hypothetical protein
MNSIERKALTTILERLAFHEVHDARRAAIQAAEAENTKNSHSIKLWFKRFSTSREVRCAVQNVQVLSDSISCTLLPEVDPTSVKDLRGIIIKPTTISVRFVLRTNVYDKVKRASVIKEITADEAIAAQHDRLKELRVEINRQGWKYDPTENNLAALKSLYEQAPTIYEAYQAAVDKAYLEALEALKQRLNDEMKLDVQELIDLALSYEPAKAKAWFEANGFVNVPKLEEFPVIADAETDERKAYLGAFYVAGGWEMERKPDGYGHECGWSYNISWAARKFVAIGWSSDD